MPSFEKRKNGNWTVRFRCIENGVEVNKRLSEWNGVPFALKKDALAAYTKYINKYTLVVNNYKKDSYKYENVLKSYLLAYNILYIAYNAYVFYYIMCCNY